ncbi:hypothetical protein AB0L42_43450 [Streptomyces sp. NPDC052287]|uniref:hypothetical protein n=1 Tax=Streptomyces sp. NPDC052287 TaxID=3154950 RepID=UPI003442A6B6
MHSFEPKKSPSINECGFSHASDEVLAVRDELARQVVRVLKDAGIPAFLEKEDAAPDRGGAVVYVDSDAETASASVSVGWSCDPGMVQTAVESITAGALDAPAVRYPGMIGQHMQSALIKILLSAGVIATLENDSMNPEHVLVFGRTSDLPAALRPTFVPPGT